MAHAVTHICLLYKENVITKYITKKTSWVCNLYCILTIWNSSIEICLQLRILFLFILKFIFLCTYTFTVCVLIHDLVLLGFALHIHKITFCLRFIFASAFSLVVKLYDVRNPWIGPPGTPTIQDLRFLIFHKARLPKQRVVSYSFSLFHLCYTI